MNSSLIDVPINLSSYDSTAATLSLILSSGFITHV